MCILFIYLNLSFFFFCVKFACCVPKYILFQGFQSSHVIHIENPEVIDQFDRIETSSICFVMNTNPLSHFFSKALYLFTVKWFLIIFFFCLQTMLINRFEFLNVISVKLLLQTCNNFVFIIQSRKLKAFFDIFCFEDHCIGVQV